MPRLDLRKAVAQRTLLVDGAMGTQLFLRGLAPGQCGEAWNRDRPDDVAAIHRAYLQAGCDAVTTNTFGGSAPTLARHNLEAEVETFNRQGAALARKAAGDDHYVLGDIGPFGDFLEPMGTMTEDELLGIFTRQARALREGGADAIIIETMTDTAEAVVALRAAKVVADWPVITTFAFDKGAGEGYHTMMGQGVEHIVKTMVEAGADVVGANCGTSLGLPDYLALAKQLVAAAGKTPVIMQPNAGSPQTVDGKVVYAATGRDMAELAKQLRAAGVKMVGGCCGTTPELLGAMK
ncbi:MAG: homocysteine S-methyltransferase family protein [Phycisphaeraceae bacterium]|nr:homocysteine S-methyltransferase family protein [Phycisphaeraceae bacterium]